jgi:hypothetical protein
MFVNGNNKIIIKGANLGDAKDYFTQTICAKYGLGKNNVQYTDGATVTTALINLVTGTAPPFGITSTPSVKIASSKFSFNITTNTQNLTVGSGTAMSGYTQAVGACRVYITTPEPSNTGGIIHFKNQASNGWNFLLAYNSANGLYFKTNNKNDSNDDVDLNIPQPFPILNRWANLIAYQDFVNNVKKVYIDGVLVLNETTAFDGTAINNSSAGRAILGGSSSPIMECSFSGWGGNKVLTATDFLRINNMLSDYA